LYHVGKRSNQGKSFIDFVSRNSKYISWTTALEMAGEKNKMLKFNDDCISQSLYRPFFKQMLYYSRDLNERVYQIPRIIPNKLVRNISICVSGVGVTNDFSALITNNIPDLELVGKSQCFPLKCYIDDSKNDLTLFDKLDINESLIADGITDYILGTARTQYSNVHITKEDIFYYVYGFLHSSDYRRTFESDLKKMLPRLPLVEQAEDFWAFSKAGRALAKLHVDYESVPPYKGVKVEGLRTGDYRVEKRRFPKKGQKDTIIYNDRITLTGIPEKAYAYVVNGKSAIEWVMERYQVTVHKESGIRNDPNDWARECGNPRYILDLLLSVINLSVQTVDLVDGLPRVKFE
jgi:predicted helicase